MSSSIDPFRHHPELRGKIADPLSSPFRQMDISAIDERMKAAGFSQSWRMSDEAREASRLRTVQDNPADEFWLFGYGSLIWDPGIHFDEVRIARISGYHRRFCLRSELGRGSPENPGLMVGLDEGGECCSLAFRIPDDAIEAETRLIWKREMLRHTYMARFVPAQTAQGDIAALAFVIDPSCDNYLADIRLEEAARYVASGKGLYGSSLEYVDNLVRQLNAFGIEDPSIEQLRELSLRLNAA